MPTHPGLTPITAELFLVQLGRHAGHTLRANRELVGQLAAASWIVDAVSLRCEDCGEVLIEGIARTYPGRRRKGSRL